MFIKSQKVKLRSKNRRRSKFIFLQRFAPSILKKGLFVSLLWTLRNEEAKREKKLSLKKNICTFHFERMSPSLLVVDNVKAILKVWPADSRTIFDRSSMDPRDLR